MKRMILNELRRCRQTAKLLACRNIWRPGSYLEQVGWLESFRRSMAVDHQLQPLPWFTYPSIAFLNDRLNRSMSAFEYGSGNSTIWLAQRVSRVVSCEHDRGWYQRMRPLVPANVDYVWKELADGYCEVASRFRSEFDIVVIDGRQRVNCARSALPSLSVGGVLIWDNSDRERYQPGFDLLHERGFRKLDFWGPGPVTHVLWCTSVFYRDENCLGI